MVSLFSDAEWSGLVEHLNLSGREAEVLACLLDDLAVKEIAAKIEVAPTTARTYANRLFKKLQVSGRTSAVVRAFYAYLEIQRRQHSD